MQPTNEQVHIGQLAKASKNVKVIAGAGAGKSSTLRYLAKQVPARNVLVLTFNKANAEDTLGHTDRPENLFASTIHSLAYRAVIDPFYKKKLSNYLDYNDINLNDLQQAIYATGLPSVADEKKALVLYRRTILDCIKLFCQSGDLSLRDFSENYIKYILVTSPSSDIKFKIPIEVAFRLVSIIEAYWVSLVSGDAKINHDIYLKLFHLQRESIKEVWSTELKRYVTVQVLAMDECLTATQTVKTDQGLMRIKRLYTMWAAGESTPMILSYNIEKDIYEYKEMLSALKSEGRDTLLIKTEGLNKIECTPNHRILTQRGYVPADKLIIGKDYLLIDEPTNQKAKLVLNDDQYQIMLGSFLGDGWLEKRSNYNTYRLSFTQGEKQLDYLKIKSSCFGVTNIYNGYSGYTGEKSSYSTSSKTFLLDKSPWECLHDMDARALAIWYMDDGSLTSKGSWLATIHSNNFTYEQNTEIKNILFKNFGLVATIKRSREFYHLTFNVPETAKLLKIVAPYMVAELGYKNPLYSANNQYSWDNKFKNYAGNYVSSIEAIGKHTVYDIEVADNHNFITTRSINNQLPSSGIIVHNCQDTNPVTEAIFNNQNHLQRIVVGDGNQSLYRWRGATDAMSRFNDYELGYLSESFRFNNEIARLANIVLERNNSPLRLIGSGKHTEITTRAILCRTNATVLETFFDTVTSGTYSGKINVSTDVKTTFSKMYHLQAAYFNKEIKYPVSELSSITDQASMLEALDYSEELVRLNNLCLKLCDAAGSLYRAQQLLAQFTADKGEVATLTISTLHASKGLEFGHVTLADDFITLSPETDLEYAIDSMWDDVDMRCLLYVGVTRAMVEVKLPWYLEDSFRR